LHGIGADDTKRYAGDKMMKKVGVSMKLIAAISACLIVLSLPERLLACGGCIDPVFRMTSPWAGFGGVFLWAWILTMLIARWRLRRRGSDNVRSLVRGSTLLIFAILGSVGYVLLVLSIGSLLLPSFFVGFIWAVYLTIRLLADIFRVVCKRNSKLRAPVLINSVFVLAVVIVAVCLQMWCNSLGYNIACLRYGRQTAMYGKVMPGIVSYGPDAINPLIQATNEALQNEDTYVRTNIVAHSAFCLARIGGPEAEQFLADLLKQHKDPEDFGYDEGFRAVCFSYARCAGPRATDELINLFEEISDSEDRRERWVPLVALLVTGGKQGVVFVFDHMDLLLNRMRSGDVGVNSVIQSAVGPLVFGSDPKALTMIPAYRHSTLMGATWIAEPRVNDYNSEFFWIASSEALLHPSGEIVSAWEENSASIRKRWIELFD
jgi:hypothetical protein